MRFEKALSCWNSFLNFTDRNTPHILTATALFGLAETGYLAFKAGSEVNRIMKGHREAMEDLENFGNHSEFYKNEIIKDTTKALIPVVAPPILIGGATAACIVGADHISSKRIASLSAAYALADTAYKEYRSKVTEMVGEKKTRAIQESISKDKVQRNPVPEESQILLPENGQDCLCMDSYSGRYFYSSANKIERAINELCHNCMTDMYVSLNDLYYLIGIPPVTMGNDFGWNVDDLVMGSLPITLTAVLTDDRRPCLCLDYDVRLRKDYRNLH